MDITVSHHIDRNLTNLTNLIEPHREGDMLEQENRNKDKGIRSSIIDPTLCEENIAQARDNPRPLHKAIPSYHGVRNADQIPNSLDSAEPLDATDTATAIATGVPCNNLTA